MSVSLDLRRRVPARLLGGEAFLEHDVRPGDCTHFVNQDGTVEDLVIACPGCGRRSSLPLVAGYRARWTVASGDVRDPTTLTLSPSIFHRVEDGGCGWHGFLRAGVFEPC